MPHPDWPAPNRCLHGTSPWKEGLGQVRRSGPLRPASQRGRTRCWGPCPATRWTQVTVVGSSGVRRVYLFPGSRPDRSRLAWGEAPETQAHLQGNDRSGPGWASATGQGPRGARAAEVLPQKTTAQHGAGNPFLSLFPKSPLKSHQKQDGGKAHALGFGVDVVFSLKGLKRPPSDTWGSVGSTREGPSEDTLARPARLRHRDSTPRSLPPLPSGPLAPGRFNGVIYSRERPLSGPAK